MKPSAAFREPNHTQTPNDFFEMIPDMGEAELRVTLIMIRETFGWHREDFKMGIKKLMVATGLSKNGVKKGAMQAENRGTFKRSNPNKQGEAEWTLVIESEHALRGSASDPPGQPVTPRGSASDPQLGVKESIKEINDDESLTLEQRTALLVKLYEENIGVLTPLLSESLKDAAEFYTITSWYQPAFEIAVKNNARRWNYVEAVLKGWKEHEFGWKPERKNGRGNGSKKVEHTGPEIPLVKAPEQEIPVVSPEAVQAARQKYYENQTVK